jgi:hypothetical protein
MLQMYERDPGRPGLLHDFETREGPIHGLVSTLCGAFWFALEQAAATILQQQEETCRLFMIILVKDLAAICGRGSSY